jgi:hypothetical protein
MRPEISSIEGWYRKCNSSRIWIFMPANPIDLVTASIGTRENAMNDPTYRPERRRRARTLVHWRVLLFPEGGSDGIETVTQNLSSTGFYCLSATPFSPGESLFCSIIVPAHDSKSEVHSLALECTVQVMRAESASNGLYGIACQIEDYHLTAGGTRL